MRRPTERRSTFLGAPVFETALVAIAGRSRLSPIIDATLVHASLIGTAIALASFLVVLFR
ncbi:MAG: hypothetical protein CME05_06645 [Gemmatimonadaceae bacterium]|nr:hypothetical protein [Gemmatimonadaceae bacterium]